MFEDDVCLELFLFRQLFISNYSSKHFFSSGGNKRKENSYFQNIRLIWNLSLKNRPTDIVLLGYKSKFSFAGRGRKLKSDFFPLIPDSLYLSKNCQRLLCSCMPFFLTLELPEMTNKEFVVPISTLLREEMWWEEKKENNESEYIIWLKTKFSELKSEELSCRQYREFILR